jgi:hypothetical protein
MNETNQTNQTNQTNTTVNKFRFSLLSVETSLSDTAFRQVQKTARKVWAFLLTALEKNTTAE